MEPQSGLMALIALGLCAAGQMLAVWRWATFARRVRVNDGHYRAELREAQWYATSEPAS